MRLFFKVHNFTSKQKKKSLLTRNILCIYHRQRCVHHTPAKIVVVGSQRSSTQRAPTQISHG